MSGWSIAWQVVSYLLSIFAGVWATKYYYEKAEKGQLQRLDLWRLNAERDYSRTLARDVVQKCISGQASPLTRGSIEAGLVGKFRNLDERLPGPDGEVTSGVIALAISFIQEQEYLDPGIKEKAITMLVDCRRELASGRTSIFGATQERVFRSSPIPTGDEALYGYSAILSLAIGLAFLAEFRLGSSVLLSGISFFGSILFAMAASTIFVGSWAIPAFAKVLKVYSSLNIAVAIVAFTTAKLMDAADPMYHFVNWAVFIMLFGLPIIYFASFSYALITSRSKKAKSKVLTSGGA